MPEPTVAELRVKVAELSWLPAGEVLTLFDERDDGVVSRACESFRARVLELMAPPPPVPPACSRCREPRDKHFTFRAGGSDWYVCRTGLFVEARS